ncbi:MAG: hypothetical protein E3J71_09360 [Candidatus Stahlbacteria bacterium]|nr:MAG: hypothetical protein E3J71_09360 [Candidatus Stahlbacteria bacterium]
MNDIVIPSRALGEVMLPDFCPRCYWLKLHCDRKLPFESPFPGIFNSIDAYGKKVVHYYFENHQSLPPWFPDIGQVKAYVAKLHHSSFRYRDQAYSIVVSGTPDDMFQMEDGSYHIVDYKTAKATSKQDQLFPMYDAQLNIYAYIANRIGFSPVSAITLIYTEPITDIKQPNVEEYMGQEEFWMNFKATPFSVQLRPDELVPEILKKVRTIVNMIEPPEGHPDCKDCERFERVFKLMAPHTS